MDQWNEKIASSLYQPLKGDLPLRLLHIHPGRASEPLKTELIPTTLQEARGTYDATSYTWGSPENPELINCGEFQLWVQRNAFHMMLDLRKADEPCKVWIDAVCINQCSLDERAAQVAIMHHIYRGAGTTWIWMGRPDAHSSVALKYAATLDAKKSVGEFSACEYGAILSRFVEKSYFFDASFTASVDTNQMRNLAVAIVDFLNRPWFSRVWIQQEASLSQTLRVICGPDAVEWDNIFALAWVMCPRYTETWPDYIHPQLSRTINNIQAVRIIQKARHIYYQDTYGPTDVTLGFEGLVDSVSRYEATDARDRIYAMGNMIGDSDQWFEVDYRIPWQILFTDVARRFLDADTLRFLKNAGRVRQEPNTSLPSWAPDYRYKEESTYMLSAPTLWKAGGNSTAAFIAPQKGSNSRVSQLPKGMRRELELSDELKNYRGSKKWLLQSYASLRCLMSDEIVYVGSFVDSEIGTLKENIALIVQGIRKDIDYVNALQIPRYINSDAMLDAYKLTLIMGCDAQQEIVRPDYIHDNWEDWFGWYEQGCPGYWDTNAKIPALNPAFESSGAMKTFRFAVTKHGYFCLVPRTVEIGDEMAILQSYELAVVLRRLPLPKSLPPASGKQAKTPGRNSGKVTIPEPYFELLGDAYVHGMMENEARCINDEFNCRFEPTQAQLDKLLKASDGGRGEAWTTLDLSGQYERIFETLGPRVIRLV
ncbi:hypothetical protein F5Y03DRAFT_365783 [Xylaria venustula]|nr:hypothetical protein F5Y03DRAFT_365783 [Xylaria venustula]